MSTILCLINGYSSDLLLCSIPIVAITGPSLCSVARTDSDERSKNAQQHLWQKDSFKAQGEGDTFLNTYNFS